MFQFFEDLGLSFPLVFHLNMIITYQQNTASFREGCNFYIKKTLKSENNVFFDV